MATENHLSGECFCGAIKFEITLPIKSVINCHCNACRRLSGAAYTTWVSVPSAQFRYLKGEGNLTRFEVSPDVVKRFCSACGTPVAYFDSRYQGILGIPAGIIRAFSQPPAGHYFVSDKASWLDICDSLPEFGGSSGFEPLSP